MAAFDVKAGSGLAERIRFIKFCPTMDGRGAHMVVSTDQGPMHLIYMPNTSVADGREFLFGQMQAHLVNLDEGSVAIIGRPDQPIDAMDSLVRASIIPVTASA